MLEDLQARADSASPFINAIFSVLSAVAGFGIGLALGGGGKQYACAILAAALGFFFLKIFVTLFRFALMLTILAAVGWAAWFLWTTVLAKHFNQ